MKFKLNWQIGALFLFCISIFTICFIAVRAYYQTSLPYYDSVGSYWNMFDIMNTVQKDGIISGIQKASQFSLSWVQSFFAVSTTWILPRSPEWTIILNIILLFFAQWAVYNMLRKNGASLVVSLLASLVVLLPGCVVGWEGGLIDMRRDIQFLLLLTSAYFSLCSYVWKPSLIGGIVAGIFLGLAQWSRGNAIPYISIIVLSLFIATSIKELKKREIAQSLKKFMLPLSVMFIIVLPFYLAVGKEVYLKYALGSWALGMDRTASLIAFLKAFILMLLGPSSSMLRVNAVGILVIVCLIYIGYKLKVLVLKKNWYKSKKGHSLLISGFLIISLVFLFNALVLGVGEIGGIFPNFPSLVGIYALCVYMIGGLDIKRVSVIYPQYVLIIFAIAILCLTSVRIYSSMPRAQNLLRKQAINVAKDMGPVLSGKLVTYLFLDHINVHDLNFYLTQMGEKPIYAGSVLEKGVDTEMPPNPKKTIPEQQKAYAHGIRTRKYILVSEDTNVYANPQGFFFILVHGKPVVDKLLRDPKMKRIYQFKALDQNFVVLENKD